jgi:hypothetical protein
MSPLVTAVDRFGLHVAKARSRNVNAISIGPDQFQRIVDICKRVIISASTPAQELRFYLALRLGGQYPPLARAIAELDDEQFGSLHQEILDALYVARN